MGFVDGPSVYAYAKNNPVMYTDPDGLAKKKFQKPQNPNQRKGAESRQPKGLRERNLGHDKGEEHSRRPKGGIRTPKGPNLRGFGPLFHFDMLQEFCRQGIVSGPVCLPRNRPPPSSPTDLQACVRPPNNTKLPQLSSLLGSNQ